MRFIQKRVARSTMALQRNRVIREWDTCPTIFLLPHCSHPWEMDTNMTPLGAYMYAQLAIAVHGYSLVFRADQEYYTYDIFFGTTRGPSPWSVTSDFPLMYSWICGWIKRWNCRWFETSWRSMWCHCNDLILSKNKRLTYWIPSILSMYEHTATQLSDCLS